METETLAKRIFNHVSEKPQPFTFKELNEVFTDQKPTTIRGRVYDNLGKYFLKLDKGVYIALTKETKALIIQGDSRSLTELADNSIDAIITDHPWRDTKSHRGGNRNFTGSYEDETFSYNENDFKEKFRVLKNGAFLVENLPEENSNNWEYLHHVKKLAVDAGFKYFAQVPWKKGKQVNNTGRKSKNLEMLVFFSKGDPRRLRFDKQRTIKNGKDSFMKGTSSMLPTEFDYAPPSRKNKKHQAEKPVELFEAVIEQITKPGEIVLDQFAGSLNIILAAINMERHVLAYEIDDDIISKNLEALGIDFEKLN